MRKATVTFVMSVRLSVHMEHLSFQWTDVYEIWYLNIFRKSAQKSQVSLKSEENNGYFTWKHMYIYDNISLNSFRMRNISGKICRENQDTHFMFNNCFPRKSCRCWDSVGKCWKVGQATCDNIIRRMRFACWTSKATNTHSEYAILISFPRQQWLHERVSLLLYTHIAFLVSLRFYSLNT